MQGTFREDLYYRLNVFPIRVPPLRERIEDLPLLVWSFVDELCKSLGKRVDSISEANMLAIQRYAWPGNVRELRNVVERAMIVANGPTLTIDLPQVGAGDTATEHRFGRHRTGPHPRRARSRQLARPRLRRRRRDPGHEGKHPRKPDGEARDPAPPEIAPTLPSGHATVILDFAYDGGGAGKGSKATLYVNGTPVAEGRVEKTQPNIFSADETADVGIDNQTSVAEGIGIGPETRFTGKIDKITLEVL